MSRDRILLIKRGLLAAFALAIATGLVLALMPQPVPIDSARAARTRLDVTVEEEGKTRVRNVYVVAAPIAGKMLRSPLDVGDEVIRNETVVAVIQPPEPELRDVRTSLELGSQVKACEANVELADAELRQARAELQFAEAEHERAQTLTEKGVAAKRTLEKAEADLRTRRAAVARAEANLVVRKRELDNARIRQLSPEQPVVRAATGGACSFEVKSPESGNVLKIITKSEQVVASGAPLLEIGNPSSLEIVVELLSADAVKVKPGARASIEEWGGRKLEARVRRIEPSGFTKVSALGIEEQRVNTILDLEGNSSDWERLGHDYRVFVRIDVYEAANALTVPLGALFRRGNQWCVFVVKDDRAVVRAIEIGQRNSTLAEVLSGLEEGETIILHPSDRVTDGVRVRERAEGE